MLITDINTLVLAGGAIRGFALLGAIQYLQDKNVLKQITKFVGTSIGAIISYLICIGYTPVEIMVTLTQNNFLDKLSQFDIINVLNGGGAVPFSIIQDVLEKLTIQKIGKFITMGELYEISGKNLICCTYNSTKGEIEYIGYENEPTIPCIVAVRMSANLPFLFEPFTYNGCVYIDGGVLDNLPISCLGAADMALALRMKSAKTQSDSFLDTLMHIIQIPVHHLEELKIEQMQHQCMIVTIHISGPASFQFTLEKTEKFDLFSTGYNTLREYFNPLLSQNAST